MGEDQSSSTLHDYVADMTLLEGQIEAALGRRSSEVSGHPEAADAVERFHAMAKSQKESMETRLQSAGEAGSSSIGTVAAIAFDTASSAHGEGAPRHVATVLHEIYTLFTHAVLGYSMLHAAAHRVYDLTTAEDLATQHMKGYAAAAQEIHQLIADVVCWELSNDGQECRCVCDVCGLGLCICASHSADELLQAWGDECRTFLKGHGHHGRGTFPGSAGHIQAAS